MIALLITGMICFTVFISWVAWLILQNNRAAMNYRLEATKQQEIDRVSAHERSIELLKLEARLNMPPELQTLELEATKAVSEAKVAEAKRDKTLSYFRNRGY